MRVLIVAAVLACAAASPSGWLGSYNHGYNHGHFGHAGIAVAHAAPVAVAHAHALPTISPGDIAGAAIDAHVEAADHTRAAVDAHRQLHDQASELHGRAINAAEDHSWQAVDAAQTAQAQWDGAAAGAAPVLAKQLAYSGHGYSGHGFAGHGYAGHGYAAPAVAAYSAPAVAAYSAPAYAGSSSFSSQSLSQSHPAPVYHAVPAYSHGVYNHGW